MDDRPSALRASQATSSSQRHMRSLGQLVGGTLGRSSHNAHNSATSPTQRYQKMVLNRSSSGPQALHQSGSARTKGTTSQALLQQVASSPGLVSKPLSPPTTPMHGLGSASRGVTCAASATVNSFWASENRACASSSSPPPLRQRSPTTKIGTPVHSIGTQHSQVIPAPFPMVKPARGYVQPSVDASPPVPGFRQSRSMKVSMPSSSGTCSPRLSPSPETARKCSAATSSLSSPLASARQVCPPEVVNYREARLLDTSVSSISEHRMMQDQRGGNVPQGLGAAARQCRSVSMSIMGTSGMESGQSSSHSSLSSMRPHPNRRSFELPVARPMLPNSGIGRDGIWHPLNTRGYTQSSSSPKLLQETAPSTKTNIRLVSSPPLRHRTERRGPPDRPARPDGANGTMVQVSQQAIASSSQLGVRSEGAHSPDVARSVGAYTLPECRPNSRSFPSVSGSSAVEPNTSPDISPARSCVVPGPVVEESNLQESVPIEVILKQPPPVPTPPIPPVFDEVAIIAPEPVVSAIPSDNSATISRYPVLPAVAQIACDNNAAISPCFVVPEVAQVACESTVTKATPLLDATQELGKVVDIVLTHATDLPGSDSLSSTVVCPEVVVDKDSIDAVFCAYKAIDLAPIEKAIEVVSKEVLPTPQPTFPVRPLVQESPAEKATLKAPEVAPAHNGEVLREQLGPSSRSKNSLVSPAVREPSKISSTAMGTPSSPPPLLSPGSVDDSVDDVVRTDSTSCMPGLGRRKPRPSLATPSVEEEEDDCLDENDEVPMHHAVTRRASRRDVINLGEAVEASEEGSGVLKRSVTESLSKFVSPRRYSCEDVAEDWSHRRRASQPIPEDVEESNGTTVEKLEVIYKDICSRFSIPEIDVELDKPPADHFGQITTILLESRQGLEFK